MDKTKLFLLVLLICVVVSLVVIVTCVVVLPSHDGNQARGKGKKDHLVIIGSYGCLKWVRFKMIKVDTCQRLMKL